MTRWCGEAEREEYANDFEVESILDARGPADNRFFLVKWKGMNTATNMVHGTPPNQRWRDTWELARYLDSAQAAVDTFWESSPRRLSDNIAPPLEFRSMIQACSLSVGPLHVLRVLSIAEPHFKECVVHGYGVSCLDSNMGILVEVCM